MAHAWGGWAVPRRVLLLCTAVAVALLVPLVAGYLLAGVPATLAIALGYIACSGPALRLRPRHALALAVPVAMTGAVAVALRGQPVAAACFVALCCLLVAPASMVADTLMAGLPSVAAVLVAVPGDLQPGPVALWLLVGGAAVVGLAALLPSSGSTATGLPARRAWLHASVMGVVVGAAVYVVALLDWPHGYWLPLTLSIVLRPFDDETLRKSWQRVLGTVAGALVAVVLSFVLPPWVVVVAVGACLVLALCYLVRADYPRQVIFLTPVVVLLGPAVSPGGLAVERVLLTVLGAALAAVVAVGVARFDRRWPEEG
ncbi:MAG: FUSC family protein [Propionicimonas sp.]|uniref:FUSC family protein n=1 Tax=Propionicimonas sp. TaxID=1955623 RepID=UPI003D0D8420